MKKRIFPAGALVAAAWVLFNPNITLLDLLPDLVAYALILYALRHIKTFVPYMRNASEAFRKLFLISAIKIPSLVIMMSMATERITVTLFTLTFAVLELVFLFPAFNNLFDGLFYLGERFGCEAAIRETRYQSGVNAIRSMTYLFISVKAALSTLPDFSFLFTYDPLTGRGFTVSNTQYLIILSVAFAIALAVGIVWLTFILPYFRALARDHGVCELRSPLCADLHLLERRRLGLSLPYLLFTLGTVLSLDFVLDNKHVLPDYLAAACFLAVAILLLRGDTGHGIAAVAASGTYLVSTVLFTVFRSRFYRIYTDSDIARIPAAERAYLPVMITSAIAELLFLACIVFVGLAIGRFYRRSYRAEEPKNDCERRLLYEEMRSTARKNIAVTVLSVFSSAASFLSVLLVRYTHAVATHPGYGGITPYMPVTGSFWLAPFLLSLALIILTAVTANAQVKALYAAHGLDDEHTSATE